MRILYIVFGNNTEHHLQAAFSIYSFLAQKKEAVTIHIITDRAEMYDHVSNEVDIIKIDDEILEEWKGEFDFFWRIKLKAIQYMTEKFEGDHILYLDSDTFLFGDISYLIHQLNDGRSLMHLCEGEWRSLQTKTEKMMWKQIYKNSFGNISITEKYLMWNAGVVGIPGKSAGLIARTALQVCDDMLKSHVTRRLIEQYALAASLFHISTMVEAKDQIGHYWSNKESWNKLISNFFIEHFLKNSQKEVIVAALKEFNFAQVPVYLKKSNTNRRLKKIIDSYFPDSKEEYSST